MITAFFWQVPFMPDQASTHGPLFDLAYVYMWAMTFFFAGIVYLVILVSVVRYRRRAPGEIPRPLAASLKLEAIVNSFIFLVFVSAFVAGLLTYYQLYRVPDDTTFTIYAVGKQWMWQFQHPTGEREINELHIPMNTKIKVVMSTEDVIHSLYFPAFRIKSDVIPGRYTQQWFEATKEGTYYIFCSEYCGLSHSGMNGQVIVMKETDYQAWVAGNANEVSPIEAGQKLYQSLGCTTCHGANAEGARCPPLINLYGSQVELQDGTSVVADEAYIRESIVNPQAKLVAGYPNIMPTYQGQVTEEQLLQLVTYIKSLAPGKINGIETTAPARSNNPQMAPPTLDSLGGGDDPKSYRTNPLAATAPGGSGSGAAGGGSAGSQGSKKNAVPATPR